MTTDFRALLLELIETWDSFSYADAGDATDRMNEAVEEARAALAKPEPPADREVANRKPPLGLMPRWLADEHRLSDVDAALQRYRDADMVPLNEWIEERRDLLSSLQMHRPADAALAAPEPQPESFEDQIAGIDADIEAITERIKAIDTPALAAEFGWLRLPRTMKTIHSRKMEPPDSGEVADLAELVDACIATYSERPMSSGDYMLIDDGKARAALLAKLMERLAVPVPVGATDEALANFTAWFCRNYPGPDTIIHKPEWHAPRVFRAAAHALARWGTPNLAQIRSSLGDGPSDAELLELMPQQFQADLATVSRLAAHGTSPDVTPGLFRVSLNTGALDYARAVLARWGRQPAPDAPASCPPGG